MFYRLLSLFRLQIYKININKSSLLFFKFLFNDNDYVMLKS